MLFFFFCNIFIVLREELEIGNLMLGNVILVLIWDVSFSLIFLEFLSVIIFLFVGVWNFFFCFLKYVF